MTEDLRQLAAEAIRVNEAARGLWSFQRLADHHHLVADAVLAAVVPTIRGQIAEEIAAEIDAFAAPTKPHHYNAALGRAAKIARRHAVPEESWMEAIGNARVRFWVCPVREHGDRRDGRGWSVVTVDWRDGVAYCTAPGCDHSSAEVAGND